MAWWNELPVFGGLAGAVFGNPEEEAHQDAMRKASQAMMAYRPDAMNTRMNAMGSMSHAFDPMNNMMGQMYGPQAQMNMQQTIQNPFPKAMQSNMVEQAFKPELSADMQKDFSKFPKQIQERIKAAQAKQGAADRTKAGY